MARKIGQELNARWRVGAAHALYSEKGTWYHLLERFPGALFDAEGYVVFATKRDYETCQQLNRGKELNVRGGISSLPGYVRVH